MAIDAAERHDAGSEGNRGPVAEIPEETLGSWIARRLERYADGPAALRRTGPGSFTEVTYTEFRETARSVAGGLQDRGVEPGDRVAIRAETSYEWSVVDVASLLAGAVLVPVYPSFSATQAAYVVEDAGADVLVTEGTTVAPAVRDVVGECLDVADLPSGEYRGEPGGGRGVEDVATLIYTSGTTGDPKGVELTHYNVRAEMALVDEAVPDYESGLRGTSFLPLSHVYQRVMNYYLWDQGQAAVYMSPDTLLADLTAAEPAFMATVPRVYRRMYDGLTDEIAAMRAPKARLVEWALDVARDVGHAMEDGGPQATPGLRAKRALAERLVFSTLRERLGLANVEYAVTGAASLDADLLRTFWGMGVPLLEGYGATETTAGLTFNRLDGFRAGTVGTPLAETEIRLAPDGEVLARGPTIMRGYWNRPEATDESLVDGWYHTGDVGEWDGDYLRIVDRKKHMQVLDTGKNVYAEPIETALRRQPHVAEALVVADGRKYVSALVQPNFDGLLTVADREGIDYAEGTVETDGDETVAVPGSLVDHPAIQTVLESEVAAANDDLADYQTVKRFTAIDRAFSVEAGELTPTLKKRRSHIEENFAGEIAAMYDGN